MFILLLKKQATVKSKNYFEKRLNKSLHVMRECEKKQQQKTTKGQLHIIGIFIVWELARKFGR